MNLLLVPTPNPLNLNSSGWTRDRTAQHGGPQQPFSLAQLDGVQRERDAKIGDTATRRVNRGAEE